MAVFNHHAISFKISPTPKENTSVTVDFSPIPLLQHGFNLPVEISTATVFRESPLSFPLSSMVVMAHFDTGASSTSIDINLAKHMDLLVLGQKEVRTAAGKRILPNFAVDISFLNTKLSPFYNLPVGSCDLGFILEPEKSQLKPQNMGLLLGRDIMSKWNIIWNGHTSTVIISD